MNFFKKIFTKKAKKQDISQEEISVNNQKPTQQTQEVEKLIDAGKSIPINQFEPIISMLKQQSNPLFYDIIMTLERKNGNKEEIYKYLSELKLIQQNIKSFKDKILTLTNIKSNVNAENINNSNFFTNIAHIINLQNNTKALGFSKEMEDTICEFSNNCKSFIEEFKSFKAFEVALKNQIDAFSKEVEELKKLKGAEYDAKKQPFVEKSNILTQKRNEYTKLETEFNAKIKEYASKSNEIIKNVVQYFENMPDEAMLNDILEQTKEITK